MVEIFNKLLDLNEKKFRDFCNYKTKSINKDYSIDIACSLFYLAPECEFEKVKSLFKTIKQKDKYLLNLIKSDFPYCYLIGDFKEKEWYDAKKKLVSKFNNSIILPSKSKKQFQRKSCLIFSNDLRSHLGGISIIPYLKLIKKNLNYNFTLLTKNYSQIKHLKYQEKNLFNDYLYFDKKLKQKLYNSYFDLFINATGNLLNSDSIDVSSFSENSLNIWGYSGTLIDTNDNPVLLDKNFQKTRCRKFYTEEINYIPNLQSLMVKKKFNISNKKKLNNTIAIFSNSYKISQEILIEIFKLIRKENIKLFFGYLKKNAKKNIFNLAKLFNVQNNIIFSKNSKFDNYIKNLKNIDILIDIPFLGGSRTVVDAISLGIPVVTIMGEKSEEKNASCILLDLNLNELIAKNIKELPKITMNTIKNYNIIRDKILLSLSKENVQKRKNIFINEFSKIV